MFKVNVGGELVSLDMSNDLFGDMDIDWIDRYVMDNDRDDDNNIIMDDNDYEYWLNAIAYMDDIDYEYRQICESFVDLIDFCEYDDEDFIEGLYDNFKKDIHIELRSNSDDLDSWLSNIKDVIDSYKSDESFGCHNDFLKYWLGYLKNNFQTN